MKSVKTYESRARLSGLEWFMVRTVGFKNIIKLICVGLGWDYAGLGYTKWTYAVNNQLYGRKLTLNRQLSNS